MVTKKEWEELEAKVRAWEAWKAKLERGREMSDIVERLRAECDVYYGKGPATLLDEAANEIERLRELVDWHREGRWPRRGLAKEGG